MSGTFTQSDYERSTRLGLERAAGLRSKLQRYETDEYASVRLKAQFCRPCHYLSDASAAMVVTTTNCRICNKEITSPTADIDVLCLECATSHSLCRRCGGDMGNRIRSKVLELQSAT